MIRAREFSRDDGWLRVRGDFLSGRGRPATPVIDMGQRTDAELVTASRRGERAAFGALIERYQHVVCAVSYSRTGDRAISEDVAQETFVAAWQQLDHLREPSKLRAWLCGIARNLARAARRRSDREVELAGELVADDGGPFEAAYDAEVERVVRAALARVPAQYREALVLFYGEGASAREVAEILGISEGAAMQRLSRGRQHLAAGVASTVEAALRRQRPRRDLAAAVLAILPAPILPSRVEPPPRSHGGSMFKLALVAAAGLAVTGTTALVVHQRASSAAPAAVASAPATAVAAVTVPPPPLGAHAELAHPTLVRTPPQLAVPAPDNAAVPPPVTATRLHALALDAGPSRGPADAPVTIVMFTDAHCRFCQAVQATVDQVWDEFPGKLRLVIKQFPVHADAVLAAEASLAAQAQDKYWAFHDQLFANADDLGRDRLIEDARGAGLDVAAFTDALDHHTFAAALAAEQDAARQIDVAATPSFLINGKHFVGAQPVENLRAEITAALAP